MDRAAAASSEEVARYTATVGTTTASQPRAADSTPARSAQGQSAGTRRAGRGRGRPVVAGSGEVSVVASVIGAMVAQVRPGVLFPRRSAPRSVLTSVEIGPTDTDQHTDVASHVCH